ncbi:early endosome antigen 1-like [Cololabis saira]|uniref:early endosome antigen 1-like n=1 Tax=Cololabis saira TaxID=129043 RepID=UPI002AD2633A|nr:early endosome antigen 1-like [Cololabis saira]
MFVAKTFNGRQISGSAQTEKEQERNEEETDDRPNSVSTHQTGEISNELSHGQDPKIRYKFLKAAKHAATDLGKHLNGQVKHLDMKRQTQTTLEEKCLKKQEKLENLLRNNKTLEQQIVAINLSLRNETELEEEYNRMKMEHKTLTQINDKIQSQLLKSQQSLLKQQHLEEKSKRKRQENQSLRMNNVILEQQLWGLNEKLLVEEKMRYQYSEMEAQREAMLDYNRILQCKVQELKDQYDSAKESIDNYNMNKLHLDALEMERNELTAQFNELDNELRQIKAMKSQCPEMQSASEAAKNDNSGLARKIQDLQTEFLNFKNVKEEHDAALKGPQVSGSAQTDKEQERNEEETDNTQQPNSVSTQTEETSNELSHDQDPKIRYNFLKAEKHAATDLRKHLKGQVKHLNMKCQTQTTLEEKCLKKQEKLENLVRNNKALEQQIVAINLSLRDETELEEEYNRRKMEHKTLTQINDKIQSQLLKSQQSLLKQQHLEEKSKRKRQENQSLRMNNGILEQQLLGLNKKLLVEEKMRYQYSEMEAQREAMLDYNRILQCKVQELKDQYDSAKESIDNYNMNKLHLDALEMERNELTAQFNKLDNELRQIKAMKSQCPEMQSASEAAKNDNSGLARKIQDLQTEFLNFKNVKEEHDAALKERSARGQDVCHLNGNIKKRKWKQNKSKKISLLHKTRQVKDFVQFIENNMNIYSYETEVAEWAA